MTAWLVIFFNGPLLFTMRMASATLVVLLWTVWVTVSVFRGKVLAQVIEKISFFPILVGTNHRQILQTSFVSLYLLLSYDNLAC